MRQGGGRILDPEHTPSVSVERLRKPAPLSEAKAQGGMAFLVSGVGTDATTTIHQISKYPWRILIKAAGTLGDVGDGDLRMTDWIGKPTNMLSPTGIGSIA